MSSIYATIIVCIFSSIAQVHLSYSQTILLIESFEDNNFASRGWYDFTSADVTNKEHIDNSKACFECKFLKGQKKCSGGTPGRHLFQETDEVYVSYWVKYSSNWEGSNKPYHPHEFHILTNADDKYVGPAITHLTLYIEQNEGRPLLALQDSKNVDKNCILLNNKSFIGCNGNFDSYQFTENRSVAACNGIMGGYDKSDCFYYGNGYYYSARAWDFDTIYFQDTEGPYYKNNWHHIEAYFKLNSIVDGKGIPDGQIKYWYDSRLLISYDNILMRTAQFPNMKFNQILIAPYIGDGSPVEQTMWVDDLIVATSRFSSAIADTNNSSTYTILSNLVFDVIEISSLGKELQFPIQHIEIYNILSECLAIEDVDGIHPLQINISRLPAGIYLLRLVSSNGKAKGLRFVKL